MYWGPYGKCHSHNVTSLYVLETQILASSHLIYLKSKECAHIPPLEGNGATSETQSQPSRTLPIAHVMDWVCLLQEQHLQAHHLVPKRSGGNFADVSRPGSQGLNSRHDSLTENASHRFPTLLMEVSAVRSTVFREWILSSTDCTEEWLKGRKDHREVPRADKVQTGRI